MQDLNQILYLLFLVLDFEVYVCFFRLQNLYQITIFRSDVSTSPTFRHPSCLFDRGCHCTNIKYDILSCLFFLFQRDFFSPSTLSILGIYIYSSKVRALQSSSIHLLQLLPLLSTTALSRFSFVWLQYFQKS